MISQKSRGITLINSNKKQIVLTVYETVLGLANPFYKCEVVKDNDGQCYRLYKLLGLACPSTCLLSVYKLLALPSTQILNRQCIKFTLSCLLVFRKINKNHENNNQFFVQFFGSQFVKRYQLKQLSKSQLILMELIQKISKLQIQDIQKYQIQEYPCINLQNITFNIEGVTSSQFKNNYLRRMRNNIQSFKIKNRKYKMQGITKLIQKMNEVTKIQLLTNPEQTQLYILKQQINSNMNKQFKPFQFILQNFNFKNKTISQLNSLTLKILNELIAYRKYSSKSNGLIPEEYPLSLSNIIVVMNKTQIDNVDDWQIELDIMQPFLSVLGVSNKPISIQQILIFYSTPNPKTQLLLNYQDIIKEQLKNKSRAVQLQLAVKWLSISDLLYARLQQSTFKNLLQMCTSKKQLIDSIKLNSPNKMSKQLNIFLTNYSFQYSCSNDILQLSDLSIERLHEMADTQNKEAALPLGDDYVYEKVFLWVKFLYQIYFLPNGIKSSIQLGTFITINSKKYFLLYMIQKHLQLRIQKMLIQTYPWINSHDLNNQKYQMQPYIIRFNLIFSQYQKKILAYLDKSQTDQSRKYLQNNPNFALFQNLARKNFGYWCNQDRQKQKQNRMKQIDSSMFKIKQLITTQYRSSYQKYLNDYILRTGPQHAKNRSNFVIGKKSLMLLDIMFEADQNNYTNMILLTQNIFDQREKQSDQYEEITQLIGKEKTKLSNILKKGINS